MTTEPGYQRIDISYEEYSDPSQGWAKLRSFPSYESAYWYQARLDEPGRCFAVVAGHPYSIMIAVRDRR
jgi:hypothetical protein